MLCRKAATSDDELLHPRHTTFTSPPSSRRLSRADPRVYAVAVNADDRITPREFHAAEGVNDWRVLFDGAKAYFATGSFARGMEFVAAVAALAEEANHHPDVDLRYGSVVLRLTTHDFGDIGRRDQALAQRISRAAAELGIPADPAKLQTVQATIDALAIPAVLPFWQALLGYDKWGEEDLVDPLGRGPNVWFQQLDAPRPQRNRIHLDLSVPRDQAQARIDAAVAAGGHIVSDAHAPSWWTLADPEGNEADVAPWRDDAE